MEKIMMYGKNREIKKMKKLVETQIWTMYLMNELAKAPLPPH
jgi:hypothetical protein